MANKDKLIATAQKFLVKGQVSKAVSEYQKLVHAFPKDYRNRQKLAELLSRERRNEEALNHYEQVAQHYADTGFYLKAIAVYKQMQKLDSSRVDIYHRLAELSEKQGLIGNALTEYRNLISFYEQNEMYDEAVDVLFKMAELDPDNLNILVKLIECYQKSQRENEAYKQFSAVIESLSGEGEHAKIIKLYDRFIGICPEDKLAMLPLVDALIVNQQADKSIAVLQNLLKHFPEDSDVMLRLADSYAMMQDYGNARLTLQHLVKVQPEDWDLRLKLIRVCLEEGEDERALAYLEETRDQLLASETIFALQNCYENLHQKRPNDPVIVQSLSIIQETIASTGKSEGQLNSELPSGHQAFSQPEQDPVKKSTCDAESKTTGPEHEMSGQEEPQDNIDTDKFSPGAVDLSLEYDVDHQSSSEAESLQNQTPRSPGPSHEMPETSEEQNDEDILVEVEFDIDDLDDFDVEVLTDMDIVEGDEHERAAEPIEDLETIEELNDSEIDEEIEVLEDVVSLDSVEEQQSPTQSPEEQPSNPLNVQAELDDVDFYLGQGLFEKAEQLVRSLLDHLPNMQVLNEKLNLIEQQKIAANSKEDTIVFSDFISGLDAEELLEGTGFQAESESGQENDVSQKLPSELESEDTESHFNLGIAYKEMGLFDDAIEEFNKASGNISRQIDCLTLKGQCYMEKGNLDLAETAYQEALRQDSLNEEARMTLHYELGVLYQRKNRLLEAMENFQVVADKDLFFRAVGEKLNSLRKALGIDEDDGNNGPQGNRDRVSYL